MTQKRDDTPILNELEGMASEDQATAQLLHTLSEKVAFYTMIVGHLLMRLQAVDPASSVTVTPKFKNLALGLPMCLGIAETEQGDEYHLYIDAKNDGGGMQEIARDELIRRDANGLNKPILDAYIVAAQQQLQERIERERSGRTGIVGLDGKELRSSKGGSDTKAGGSGTTGEI